MTMIVTAAPNAAPKRQLLESTMCGNGYGNCTGATYCDWSMGSYGDCQPCPSNTMDCNATAWAEEGIMDCHSKCSGAPEQGALDASNSTMASNSSFGAGGESRCASQNFGLRVSTECQSFGMAYNLTFDTQYFDAPCLYFGT